MVTFFGQQFLKRIFFAYSLNQIKIIFKQIRENLGAMAMKKYSALFRSPEVEPHYHVQFEVIPKKPLGEGLLPLQRI